MDGNVTRALSLVFTFLDLFAFVRVSSHLADFNACNKTLTSKLLYQGCQYQKLSKACSKFDCRHYELIFKYDTGLKHFCYKAYPNLNFMVTSCVSLENLIFSANISKIAIYFIRKGHKTVCLLSGLSNHG